MAHHNLSIALKQFKHKLMLKSLDFLVQYYTLNDLKATERKMGLHDLFESPIQNY